MRGIIEIYQSEKEGHQSNGALTKRELGQKAAPLIAITWASILPCCTARGHETMSLAHVLPNSFASATLDV
jgi:hypothetical protein